MTRTIRNRIIVAGASGIAGAATVRHFASLPDWDVIALSRRPPGSIPPNVQFLPIDLTDREACLETLGDLDGVGYVAYTALHEQPDLLQGWRSQSQMDVNLAMLRNLLDGLASSDSRLRHIVALQGGKAYGSHLHPVAVPAKERWPRADHEIFYWPQEDFLRERQLTHGWGLTILRPSMILGNSVGSPMSIVAALGVYASLMKHIGEPLRFPGGGRYVTACTDSRLIAQAIEFAFARSGPPETYNVVNGDVLVWQDLWPSAADFFGVPLGEPVSMSLADEMPKYEETWADIVASNGLQRHPMDELVGRAWQFADHAFAYARPNPPDMIVMSPIKIRQAGFSACYDTEDSMLYWLGRMQSAKLLPC